MKKLRPLSGCTLLCLLVLLEGSCVGPTLLSDGTTTSVGSHARGVLRHGTTLPFKGDGYLIPPKWQERGRNYATVELVELLIRSARQVNYQHRPAVLGVGDLSASGGEKTKEHLSHRNGRDVDLIYYSTDLKGKPLPPPADMIYYDARGFSLPPWEQPSNDPSVIEAASMPRKLDLARNWAFIRSLLNDPQTEVQWIFVGRFIANQLLQHAYRIKEPEELIVRANELLHQPTDAQSHADHLHLRIFCSAPDREQGCIDRGPPRIRRQLPIIDEKMTREVSSALAAILCQQVLFP